MKAPAQTVALAFLLCGAAAFGATREEVQGIAYHEQGLKVVEEKCLFCHNRHRIDAAIKSRQNMEKVLKKMEGKGVILTDKDRQVMGHFWEKSPFREPRK
ncbi:hypothetical protein [Geobacter argillaceus]|uniref:Cytochrome c domain-containing protein n=1 Tax=Geobacter argillaceus TaxID=345631 RepID=A0A562WT91_9BACT|nr:hypothetical protein [Geobacter argillaceus]TWJ33521.1 hypothetical protein JN12_00195 [Geobacter argillaceus]